MLDTQPQLSPQRAANRAALAAWDRAVEAWRMPMGGSSYAAWSVTWRDHFPFAVPPGSVACGL